MFGAGDPPSTFIERQTRSLKEAGVKVSFFVGNKKHRFLSSLLVRIGFTFLLPSQSRQALHQVDVYHYQWVGHWLAYHRLSKKFHKPSVLSLRGRQVNVLPFLPGQEGYRRRLHRLLPQCDAYHCISQAILEQGKSFGLKAESASVIRPAVDPKFFFPPEHLPPPPPLKILMVGGLIWRKGYEYAILGIKHALDDGLPVELIIIGEGPDREKLAFLVQELGLEKVVHFLGSCTPAQVLQSMQSSHVFLHTSLSEGIANVILEAMSCALPVISTAVGGIGEVITDGQNGLIIPTRDPRAVADRVSRLFNSPGLRLLLGKQARQIVLKEFTLEKQAELFISLYGKALHHT